MRRIVPVLLASFLVGAGASGAGADLITFRFAGSVTEVWDPTPDEILAGIEIGDPIEAEITFDGDTQPVSPHLLSYDSTTPGSGIEVRIGDLILVSAPVVDIALLNDDDQLGDWYFFGADVAQPGEDAVGGSSRLTVQVSDPTLMALDADSTLFTSPSDFEGFPPEFRLGFSRQFDSEPLYLGLLAGELTLVPEPSTGLLVSAGMLALGLGRHRRPVAHRMRSNPA